MRLLFAENIFLMIVAILTLSSASVAAQNLGSASAAEPAAASASGKQEEWDPNQSHIGNKTYIQLPPEDRKRLIGDAKQVFDYCNKRGLFSSFHDCHCVADKFFDARLKQPQPSLNIISLGDQVAGECPNIPGVAKFEREQCMGQWGWKYKNGLQDFCECYAKSFADQYKKNPDSSRPNLITIGTNANLACDTKGIASFFQPNATASAPAPKKVAGTNPATAGKGTAMELDPTPWSPAGVSIGTPIKNAVERLEAAGYKQGRSACMFTSGGSQAYEPGSVSIMLGVTTGRCSPEALIGEITYYISSGGPDIDQTKLIADYNNKIGKEASCRMLSPARADCAWNEPPKLPNVLSIETSIGIGAGSGHYQIKTTGKKKTDLGQETVAPAFNPLTGISDLDFKAPNGVRIGMRLSDLNASLSEAGFSGPNLDNSPGDCQWSYYRKNEVNIRITINSAALEKAQHKTGDQAILSSFCREDSVVQDIQFHKTDSRKTQFAKAPTPADMISRWKSAFGSNAQCSGRRGAANSTNTNCQWTNPTGVSGLSQVFTGYNVFPSAFSTDASELGITINLKGN